MIAVFWAWLHFLAIMGLAAALVAEHLMFTPRPDAATARRLARVDMIYGVSALLVLVSGIGRVLQGGKGAAFYLANGVFHAKVGLFVVAAALSIYPTLKFLAWRKATASAGAVPGLDERAGRRVLMAIRVQLLIIFVLPLLAALMARGYGL
jgi:putative membrane protein